MCKELCWFLLPGETQKLTSLVTPRHFTLPETGSPVKLEFIFNIVQTTQGLFWEAFLNYAQVCL